MTTVLEGTRWLLSATDKKNPNERYTHPWGNVATDGFRMHIDRELPSLPKDSIPFDYSCIVDPTLAYTDKIEIEVEPLIRAIKAIRCLDNIETLRLIFHAQGPSLELTDIPAVDGSPCIAVRLFAAIRNIIREADFIIGLDPKFFLDAVTGLTCSNFLTLAVRTNKAEGAPILLQCNGRDAILMPKWLN